MSMLTQFNDHLEEKKRLLAQIEEISKPFNERIREISILVADIRERDYFKEGVLKNYTYEGYSMSGEGNVPTVPDPDWNDNGWDWYNEQMWDETLEEYATQLEKSRPTTFCGRFQWKHEPDLYTVEFPMEYLNMSDEEIADIENGKLDLEEARQRQKAKEARRAEFEKLKKEFG